MKRLAASLLLLTTFAVEAPAQATAPAPLTLSQAIDTVLTRYPSLAGAQAAIDAARARTTESNADRLTQVNAHAGYTFNSLRPFVAIDIPGRPAGAIYESVRDGYTTSVTARQLLTDFGRTDKMVAMARSGQVAAQDALEELRHQLGYQTIEAFYGVILLRNSADVAREEIAALEEALRISQRKFDAGSATKFDVLTTQVRLANARDHLTDTLASVQKQENGLRELLGLGASAPLDISGTFDVDTPALTQTEAIAAGIQNRPEIKLAVDDEQTARLRQDAADRGNRPTLAAQVTGGVADGFVPSLYDNRGYVTAGLTLDVPLFTGKRVTGERLEAAAQVRSAQAREEELRETIATDVGNAYADLNAARARLGNADTLVAQAREALDLARTRYANGVITNFELLDAQSALRSAELGRLQARYDCVLARQSVARAAGQAPQP